MASKKRKIGCVVLLALLMVGVGFFSYVRWAPAPFGAKFPIGVKSEFILKFDERTAAANVKPVLFNADLSGRPFLLVGRTVIAAKYSDDSKAEAIPLPAGEAISGFAWMGDGSLLVIEGKRLSVLTSEGLKPVQTLPQAGMELAPASTDECYIFGGKDPEQQRNLYVYRRSGSLLHLLRAEAPIAAAAGNGELTFVAINDAVYALAPGYPLTLVFRARSPVISLAIGPEFSLFYSTAAGVGFSNKRGSGELFVSGRGAEIQVRDETLYLFFPNVGIMKCSPASEFLKTVEAKDSTAKG
jgi:hypothetical protein